MAGNHFCSYSSWIRTIFFSRSADSLHSFLNSLPLSFSLVRTTNWNVKASFPYPFPWVLSGLHRWESVSKYGWNHLVCCVCKHEFSGPMVFASEWKSLIGISVDTAKTDPVHKYAKSIFHLANTERDRGRKRRGSNHGKMGLHIHPYFCFLLLCFKLIEVPMAWGLLTRSRNLLTRKWRRFLRFPFQRVENVYDQLALELSCHLKI